MFMENKETPKAEHKHLVDKSEDGRYLILDWNSTLYI